VSDLRLLSATLVSALDEGARMRRGAWKAVAAMAVAVSVTAAVPATPASAGVVDGLLGLPVDLGANAIGSLWGDDASNEGLGALRNGTWNPALDDGSMYSLAAATGVHRAWAKGYTGDDVTVALIDTGVAPVAGLDDQRIFDGPDLSFESQSAGTRYVDGFGHGTHLAGIIAGRDPGFDRRRPSAAQFNGVAPDADLLSIKVATRDGGTDVSQVIAAIDWVVEHKRDAGLDIRVLSLSYGTESVQPWQVDPLARAVENAWHNGIVVVVAAGNGGAGATRLTMPAIDPHVIAVGAVDHRGTSLTLDDTVAGFTSAGSSARRPDVLAPGKSVVSLRVAGSFADVEHPEGRVAGDSAQRFFRGSGTSQAAAVVAGQVALLLDRDPSLTPDEVKGLLMATARPLALDWSPVQGAGVTDVVAAINRLDWTRRVPTAGTAALPPSSGLGSIEAARGGENVIDPTTGTRLTGEYDALGEPWRPRAWVDAQRAGVTWNSGTYNGRTWTGTTWSNRQLLAAPWAGSSWSGIPWEQHVWSDDQWEARSWRGDSWRARSWRAGTWSARSWRSDS
jgi:serine protease AprX